MSDRRHAGQVDRGEFVEVEWAAEALVHPRRRRGARDRWRSRRTARGRGGRGHAPGREGAARGARCPSRSGAGRARARGLARERARPDHHRLTGRRMRREAGDGSAPLAARRAQARRPGRPLHAFHIGPAGQVRAAGARPSPHAPGRRREPGVGDALAADVVAALRRPGVPAASGAAPDPASPSSPRRHADGGSRDASAERRRGHRCGTSPRSAASGLARHATDGNAGGRARTGPAADRVAGTAAKGAFARGARRLDRSA